MIEPVCPDCLGSIETKPHPCGRIVADYRRVPDLRTVEDGYLSKIEDDALAARLDAEFDRRDFRSLLDFYLELAEVPVALRPGQVAHILGAGGRSHAWLAELPKHGAILDLGCGSGSFLVEVGRTREVVGCDIAMRWLMVARKRLDESGLHRVPLVCGSSERLPWPDETFSAVVAGDVIEHVSDQGATILEANRVLKPGGVLLMATPNRFSLGPEPHVGLFGVGYLPRKWMSAYVQMRGRGDFRAIRTHGLAGWRRILRESPFSDVQIEAPVIPDDDLAFMSRPKRIAARLYNRLSSTPPALRLGPTFRIVARKAPRATPPGSNSG